MKPKLSTQQLLTRAVELVLLLVLQASNMKDLLLLKDTLLHPLEEPLIFQHPMPQLQVKYLNRVLLITSR